MASASIGNETAGAPENDDAREKTKPIETSRMYSAGEVRIVVIDDDPAIGRLVEATLAGHEFDIKIVSDPSKVEPVLRQQKYHVVILDYVLPGLQSADVLRQCKKRNPAPASSSSPASRRSTARWNACGRIPTITSRSLSRSIY